MWRNSKSVMRRLFKARLDNNRNLVLAWLLLHIYLASNLLSFGFWKVGKSFFVYSVLFISVWLIGLGTLLLVFLWTEKFKDLTRLKFRFLAIITFPFFWLWGASYQLDHDLLILSLLIGFPFALAAYYRIGQSNIAGIAVSMLALSTVSFFGHSDILLEKPSSSTPPHPNMDVADITIDRTPNIHVVMFDALINSEFSKELLDQRSVGADYLAKLDDSIYAGKTGFVESAPTIPSWDALFGLGILGPEKSSRSLHFSGVFPSPLSALLRKNGYMIQTGFADAFFGYEKGPHVDQYYRAGKNRLGFNDAVICLEDLLGLCNKRFEFIFQKIDELLPDQNKLLSDQKVKADEEWVDETWAEQVFDIIENAENHAETPVFSGFYILMPGHGKGDEMQNAADFEEYRSKLSDESERVLNAMEQLNQLRLKFPESIFIVSGDHGAWLSRTMPMPMPKNENRRLWILDRYGVALSLLNEHNLCPMSRDWLERQRYLTPSRFLAAALACNGDSQKLLEIFSDRQEFITFGESLRSS